MRLADLVAVSDAVGATRSRKEKSAALAGALRELGPDEAEAGVAYLSGELRQRQIGVGWAALREPPAPADEPSIGVGELDAELEAIGALSGPGSQTARREALDALFGRATADEQRFLRALLSGELRQGALAGVMAVAVAEATGIPRAVVDRAAMLRGDARAVAALALREGRPALEAIGLEVGRPIQPMLASTAPDLDAALEKTGEAAVEFKLDGMRIQVHRDGDDVTVYTRSLDDVTARMPAVVEAVRELPARCLVLDGEALAIRDDGRPEAFQVSASRGAPLRPFFFDLLHVDGEDLLDVPGAERAARLAALVPEAQRVTRATDDPAAVYEASIAAGHEGVVVKALDAPYAAGRRGSAWVKVKPRHTLDLVILAVEWGSGRRRGLLSNLHLGAPDPASGELVMLGKTFKGLTDEMLAWQTERLLALETSRDRHVVFVRPELLAEIAFDGVQASTRYPGGMALRFARVLRHRPDKPASEADTVDAVRAIFAPDG